LVNRRGEPQHSLKRRNQEVDQQPRLPHLHRWLEVLEQDLEETLGRRTGLEGDQAVMEPNQTGTGNGAVDMVEVVIMEGVDTTLAAVEGVDITPAVVEGVDTTPAVVEGVDTTLAAVEGVDTTPAAVEGVDTTLAAVEEVDTTPAVVEGVDTTLAAVEGVDITLVAVEGVDTTQEDQQQADHHRPQHGDTTQVVAHQPVDQVEDGATLLPIFQTTLFQLQDDPTTLPPPGDRAYIQLHEQLGAQAFIQRLIFQTIILQRLGQTIIQVGDVLASGGPVLPSHSSFLDLRQRHLLRLLVQ